MQEDCMSVNPYKMKKEELLEFVTGTCKHRHKYMEHPKCFIAERKYPPTIGYLDIETNSLYANFGVMLSYAIKMDGKDEILGRAITREELRSPTFDKKLLEECIKDMNRFDQLITYNGSRFDIPFVRTRSLKWDVDFPFYGTLKHIDAYYMARGRLRTHRKSMDVVSRALGIAGKNHVDGELWIKAALQGDKDALGWIFDHNKRDVRVLEKVYKRLKDYCKEYKRSI
jgi:uncharacterized protein YprB with RNaseH-like and TPR domain